MDNLAVRCLCSGHGEVAWPASCLQQANDMSTKFATVTIYIASVLFCDLVVTWAVVIVLVVALVVVVVLVVLVRL